MNFVLNDALMGLLGGLMIGTAAAIFLLGLGRIAGISGVMGALIRGQPPISQNVAFLAGLIGVPVLYALIATPPDIGITDQTWVLLAGGLLVGVGTRLGSGCTSGHGVCGMSRFSGRSITATLAFMAVGVLVASALRPLLGLV